MGDEKGPFQLSIFTMKNVNRLYLQCRPGAVPHSVSALCRHIGTAEHGAREAPMVGLLRGTSPVPSALSKSFSADAFQT